MVKIEITDVEWDSGNISKCQKHGVSLEEIEKLLANPMTRIIADQKHADVEKRYIAVGIVGKRHIFVVFTFRECKGIIFLRPLSARYMHKKEIISYDKATSTI